MEKLLEIEMLSKELEKETNDILNNNFPMDSRDFLIGDDAKKVESNDERIAQLAKQYLEIYKSLPISEQRNYRYKNIQGLYYQNTHNSKGLLKVSSNSDEYELHEAFSKATQFGMMAIDNMFNAKKNDNKTEYIKSKNILDECIDILNAHFWGKNRIESLNRYSQRLESGRTIDDDIKEYIDLVNKCKTLTFDYAKSNLNGMDEAERNKFLSAYEDIFNKEKQLIEFIPRESLNKISVNLYWMKVDAERNPQKIINDGMEIQKHI